MKILIADDDLTSRRILETNLHKRGYEVIAAVDGNEAWEILMRPDAPKLALLDWMMPGIDGVEICRRFRQMKGQDSTYLILLTALARKDNIVEGLSAGADDYIIKPFDRDELHARLRVGQRVLDLQAAQKEQFTQLQDSYAQIEQGLKAAADVQRSLLPRELPRIPGVEFAWTYEACDYVAGDIFNVFQLDESHIGLYVLDVSGHGVPAALLSVSLSRVLTPFIEQGGILMRYEEDRGPCEIVSPGEVAEQLNLRFPVMSQTGQYFTFIYGILDFSSRIFRFVRAGHPDPVLITGGQARILENVGSLPVGMLESVHYEENSIQLAPGDELILYTDGIIEATDPLGTQFGLDKMLAILSSRKCETIATDIQALHQHLEDFVEGLPKKDDMTVLGFKVL